MPCPAVCACRSLLNLTPTQAVPCSPATPPYALPYSRETPSLLYPCPFLQESAGTRLSSWCCSCLVSPVTAVSTVVTLFLHLRRALPAPRLVGGARPYPFADDGMMDEHDWTWMATQTWAPWLVVTRDQWWPRLPAPFACWQGRLFPGRPPLSFCGLGPRLPHLGRRARGHPHALYAL